MATDHWAADQGSIEMLQHHHHAILRDVFSSAATTAATAAAIVAQWSHPFPVLHFYSFANELVINIQQQSTGDIQFKLWLLLSSTAAADISHRPLATRVSECTRSPVRPRTHAIAAN